MNNIFHTIISSNGWYRNVTVTQYTGYLSANASRVKLQGVTNKIRVKTKVLEYQQEQRTRPFTQKTGNKPIIKLVQNTEKIQH